MYGAASSRTRRRRAHRQTRTARAVRSPIRAAQWRGSRNFFSASRGPT